MARAMERQAVMYGGYDQNAEALRYYVWYLQQTGQIR